MQIDHRVPYQIAGEALVKVKSDPKLVAAAREWRDRWLERVNAGQYLPAAEGKYEVSRALSDAGAGQVEHAMPRLAGPGSTGSAQAMAA
ncbi:MAG TPA: hypothetical protein VLI90_10375 [Tepidisphaeraceae bacterium]|nr:hypothetical protein [Tepidisphaeraceae bacterium]